ncbi:carbohydrate kinase family protein [Microbacterium sp. NPDC077644]|uniref:carbohydrate kinase family protein n=1 Tax=Microbacterium sp. NPDC077644 TaxID=3155055 RepID=UPI00344DB2A7
MSSAVFIAGPASWNSIIVLDRLPEPEPHMQFAEASWDTLGGTSAGKALSLTALGVPATLYALAADDDHGSRVRSALASAGVETVWGQTEATERHVNLMTAAGGRVSLYLSVPSASALPPPREVRSAMAEAEIVVLDLAEEPRRLLPLAEAAGRPVWVDVHDYDGAAAYHRPFLAAADAVFCNADRLADPVEFLRSRVAAGASLAVCTLGAEGAVAVDEAGEVHRVDAVPADVVDTNGAGDGFFAGVLAARLAGAPLDRALRAGAEAAAVVLGSRHLHPLLDAVL